MTLGASFGSKLLEGEGLFVSNQDDDDDKDKIPAFEATGVIKVATRVCVRSGRRRCKLQDNSWALGALRFVSSVVKGGTGRVRAQVRSTCRCLVLSHVSVSITAAHAKWSRFTWFVFVLFFVAGVRSEDLHWQSISM